MRINLKVLLAFVSTILFLSHSNSVAQCFQIESILVDAFDSSISGEGLNEMVRFKIGPTAINTNNMNVIWASAINPWLGLIQNTTTATKIATINANILASGGCGQLIQPIGGVLPANANVLLITSYNFDETLNVFGGITQNIYVIFQNNPSNITGNFGNYGAPANRTLTINFGATCSDTVTYDRSLLIDAAGNNASGNGAAVNFTPVGVPTYVNIGNSAPVIVFSVDAGPTSINVCAGDTIPLNGTAQGQQSLAWSAPSGSFTSPSNISTNFSVPLTATGSIIVKLTATNTCGGSKSDTVTLNVTALVTPIFSQLAPICSGAATPTLPTTSNNDIVGVWTPPVSSTVGKTYTFTPTVGQCATSQTMTTTINTNCTFGDFASALFLTNCINNTFYNNTGSGANRINASGLTFQNTDIGTYRQNSFNLVLKGAELKSFKTTSTNVCAVNLKYRVYEQSATPGLFQTIVMPLFDACNTSTNTFNSGGPCAATDQKWQNVSQSIDLTLNPVGVYFLEVLYDINGDNNSPSQCDDTVLVNSNGANFRAKFNIVAQPIFSNITSPTSCVSSNGSFLISGLTPNATYDVIFKKDNILLAPASYLSSGSGTIIVTGLGGGTYTNIVLQIKDCSFDNGNTIVLSNPVNPSTPTFSTTSANCSNPKGSITVISPTGTDLLYSIDGADFQSALTFSDIVPNTYNLVVKNGGGCVSNGASAVVNAPSSAPSQPTFSKTDATCINSKGSITILAPLGTDFTYSIDGNNFQPQLVFNDVLPNTYNVIVKNTAGCLSATTIAIINASPQTPVAPILSVSQPTCSNPSGSVTVQSPLGSQYTYSIDGTTFQNSPIFLNIVTGSYTFIYNDGSGCISASATATINAKPTINPPTFDAIAALCNKNGRITIQSPIGMDLVYSIDNLNFQSSVAFNNLTANSYEISVKNIVSGCTSATVIGVVNNNTTTLPINLGRFEICLDKSGVPLNNNTIDTGYATTDYSFTWTLSGNALSDTTNFLTVQAAGDYQAIATDKISNCIQVFNAVVVQVPFATAKATVETDFSGNQTIMVNVAGGSGNFAYQINNYGFQSSNVFNVTNGGIYSIDIQDIIGCNTLNLMVNVIDFPRFFTPNADGYNDTWNVYGLPFADQSSLVVFDRFGKILKQLGLRSSGWDGKFNGQDLPADDYWFRLNYLDNFGTPREFKSHFSLKR